MLLDSSRWIFLKYQILIIFSNRLVKLFKIKSVHWYVWQDQLCHLISDGGSNKLKTSVIAATYRIWKIHEAYWPLKQAHILQNGWCIGIMHWYMLDVYQKSIQRLNFIF